MPTCGVQHADTVHAPARCAICDDERRYVGRDGQQWDCVPLLDDAARARLSELGGISAICMSHPHFHGAYVEFAEAFPSPR